MSLKLYRQMFSPVKPSKQAVDVFLKEQESLSFTYHPFVGKTRHSEPPEGWVVDHNRVFLGRGERVYQLARQAIDGWMMFPWGWFQLCWPHRDVAEGTVVGALACPFGVWVLNAARVVYVLDEEGEMHRYGFAYGTLPGHVELGEERFSVEWNRETDEVWYDLYAFSRPHLLVAKWTQPFMRYLQKQFGRDSKRAMVKAVKLLQEQ